MIMMIYDALLRLYPREFRELFADEMREIFELAWHDAQINQQIIPFLIHEFSQLSISILKEQWQMQGKNALTTVERARLVNRLSSIAFHGFVLLITLNGQSLDMVSIVVATYAFAMLVLSCLPPHYERNAGLTMIVLSVILSVAIGIGSIITIGWLGVLAGVVWSLPPMGFGVMFMVLSHQSGKPKRKIGV